MSIGWELFRRRNERRRWRREMRAEVAAPEARHPILGLGGRSIELSLAQGQPPSHEALLLALGDFQSAARQLLSSMEASSGVAAEDFLQAADFLVSTFPDDAAEIRQSVESDLELLRLSER